MTRGAAGWTFPLVGGPIVGGLIGTFTEGRPVTGMLWGLLCGFIVFILTMFAMAWLEYWKDDTMFFNLPDINKDYYYVDDYYYKAPYYFFLIWATFFLSLFEKMFIIAFVIGIIWLIIYLVVYLLKSGY